ncbi:MAG: MotA/TolQ/ExbB proton channel family protein [Candidatus Aphodosoma sp.]
MNTISDILYWISTGLLVPVIVLLIFFFIRAIVLIGSFFGQYIRIRKTTSGIYAKMDGLKPSGIAEFETSLPGKTDSLVVLYLKKILDNRGDRTKVSLFVSEYEIAADKDIATSKILAKVGPVLGLMGTLIPMGPALVGLSTGDIASMAHNMQVAFATTVVGLVVSTIGFLTQQVKERWAVMDMTILGHVAELLDKSNDMLP